MACRLVVDWPTPMKKYIVICGLNALGRRLHREVKTRAMIQISIDGTPHDAAAGDRLIDAINRAGVPLSQVCYLPILGPIQTCDTCIVEVDGKLVRACARCSH